MHNKTNFFSKRRFLKGSLGLASLALTTACQSRNPGPMLDTITSFPGRPGGVLVRNASSSQAPSYSSYYQQIYGPRPQERFPLPAINLSRVDPRFYRQEVDYFTTEQPGTIIVDTNQFFLFYIMPNNRAMRYGVGLGRAGFQWSGRARVARKAPWPTWTPPESMIEREPELRQYSAANGGMPPGLNNPLGARALYIFQGNRDTLYRIHGSPEYWTIGKAVSSGCVRMINQDVIDLYNRVAIQSPVIVR
jgi:lipoprotein-anchoring transpeptidase ErfK/SrfK